MFPHVLSCGSALQYGISRYSFDPTHPVQYSITAAMPGNSGRSKRLVTKRGIEEKRERLFAESNLHLNRALMRAESWDEAVIEKRGNELFELALLIWRGPAN